VPSFTAMSPPNCTVTRMPVPELPVRSTRSAPSSQMYSVFGSVNAAPVAPPDTLTTLNVVSVSASRQRRRRNDLSRAHSRLGALATSQPPSSGKLPTILTSSVSES
jgi:hypothetical protein